VTTCILSVSSFTQKAALLLTARCRLHTLKVCAARATYAFFWGVAFVTAASSYSIQNIYKDALFGMHIGSYRPDTSQDIHSSRKSQLKQVANMKFQLILSALLAGISGAASKGRQGGNEMETENETLSASYTWNATNWQSGMSHGNPSAPVTGFYSMCFSPCCLPQGIKTRAH
jgi:hypothetical protein